MYNIVKDVRGVGEGDWGKLLSHLLREMWIEISKAFFIKKFISSHLLREMWIEINTSLVHSTHNPESSPAGDVD